jgi:O-antigen/teichoic acid export membrane protein
LLSNFAHRLLSAFPFLKRLDSRVLDVIGRSSVAMLLRFGRTFASFGFNVLLARSLGADGTGVYFLAYTITRIASIIGRVGLDQTLLRFTAAHASQQQWDKVKGAYQQGMLIALAMSAIATAVVFLLAPLFAELFSEPRLVEPVRVMAFSILPGSLLVIFSTLLQGLERIGDSIFVQGVGLPLINMPILLLLAGYMGVNGAALSYVLTSILVLFLGYRLWTRYTPQLKNVTGNFELRQLTQTAVPLFWMDFTILVMGLSDTLILGFLSDSESVGIYDTTKRVAVLAITTLSAINTVVAPKFAALYAQNAIEEMGRLARNATLITTLVSIPVVLAFLIIPGPILSVFGSDFIEGSLALGILGMGQLINAATGAVGFLLTMSGHEKLMRNNAIGTSILKIVLQLVLIPPLGIIGAALASALADVLRNVIAAILVYQKFAIVTVPIPERFLRKPVD